jgi:heptosyltransferase-2
MRFAGIPERLGFDRWAAARHLTLKVPHIEKRGFHKIRRNLHLLSVFADREFDMKSEVFPDEVMDARARDLLSKVPRPGNPCVVICPASLWPTKRWPEEHFVALTTALEKKGANIIFDGGPDDHELCRTIIDAAGSDALNVCKLTSPLESAGLIRLSDLLISGDSAPVHLANAVGTTVFAINGPTDTMETGYFPFREGDRIFALEMECRPCGPHGANRCPLVHHSCMKKLLPEIILRDMPF